MATAQRARHVHVHPDCLCVSVIDLVTVCLAGLDLTEIW